MLALCVGLSLVTNAEHALTTSGELMDILQNFVLWRAKIHFKEKHLSIKQFDTFLSEYCKDKATSLTQDFRIISQELFYTLPSIQASQIYVSHHATCCMSMCMDSVD